MLVRVAQGFHFYVSDSAWRDNGKSITDSEVAKSGNKNISKNEDGKIV